MNWLFCGFQVSLVLFLAWVLSSLLLNGLPRVSAHVGLIGMVCAFAIVIATVLGIPRPFQLALSDSTQANFVRISAASTHELTDNTTFNHQQPTQIELTNNSPPFHESSRWKGVGDVSKYLTGFANQIERFYWLKAVFCCVFLGRFLFGIVSGIQLFRATEPITNFRISRLCDELSTALVMNWTPQPLCSHQIKSPCTSWLFPRTILFPASIEEWQETEIRSALAHELAHLKHRDPLTRLIMELCFIAICWHPVAWLLRGKLILAQELAADRIAAQQNGGKSNQYLLGLMKLALRLDHDSRRVPSFCVSFHSSCLIRRIEMLKRNSGIKVGRESGWWLLLYSLLVLGTGWLGCWTAHGQEEGPIANQIYDQPLPHALAPTNIEGEKIDGDYVCRVTAVEVDSLALKDSKFDWSKATPELASAPKSANDIVRSFSQSDHSNPIVQITETNRLMEIFDAITEHGEAQYRIKEVNLNLKNDRLGEILTGFEIPVFAIKADGTKVVKSLLKGVSLECKVAKSKNQSMVMELLAKFGGDSKAKHLDGRPVELRTEVRTTQHVTPNQAYALLLPVSSPVAREELEREIVFFVSVEELSEQE